jgi:hypothetical protein
VVPLASIYNWAGDAIIRDTIIWDKRTVLGYNDIYIPTDIREWVSTEQSEVVARALKEIDLPSGKEAGSFDLRAWKIWKYVIESVEHLSDKEAEGLGSYWLFPEETLTLGKGDSEDISFLMASLMIAGGISEQCVRVVLGRVVSKEGSFGHSWVVYQNEEGKWCLLEPTLKSLPPALVSADSMAFDGSERQYQPQFCLNASHLWWISSAKVHIADYLKARDDYPSFNDDITTQDGSQVRTARTTRSTRVPRRSSTGQFIGDMLYPSCDVVPLDNTHKWTFTEDQILDVLKKVDYGDYQSEYWDCDDQALKGMVAVHEILRGCPCGVAIGAISGTTQAHAVVIYWTEPKTYKFFDPNSQAIVSFSCKYVIA